MVDSRLSPYRPPQRTARTPRSRVFNRATRSPEPLPRTARRVLPKRHRESLICDETCVKIKTLLDEPQGALSQTRPGLLYLVPARSAFHAKSRTTGDEAYRCDGNAPRRCAFVPNPFPWPPSSAHAPVGLLKRTSSAIMRGSLEPVCRRRVRNHQLFGR